jgi:hypothetical protein
MVLLRHGSSLLQLFTAHFFTRLQLELRTQEFAVQL